MANQHYRLIDTLTLEIDGETYTANDFNLNLAEFLNQNAGKEIYIYRPSFGTDKITAIVK